MDLMEKQGTGLISLLEEAAQAIKANDLTLTQKILVTQMGANSRLVRPAGAKSPPTCFVVRHSFGDVGYDCDGFTTANKQSHLPDSAIATLAGSCIPFVAGDVALQAASGAGAEKGAGVEDANKRSSARMRAAKTASLLMSKTKTQLQALLDRVGDTQRACYVVCMTTNPDCRYRMSSVRSGVHTPPLTSQTNGTQSSHPHTLTSTFLTPNTL
ncbi:P-loop containing nucleoside triphosphate hydrolase protein [Ochromonadaceae sp. CCMP2298]|nr:P-loop containing nucleoside triphosphate hydrolase protein [Ochromonadaceae sp. CCMP2298]